MKFSKKTIIAAATLLIGIALVLVYLLVLSMAQSRVRDRLVSVGFKKSMDVSVSLTSGVTVRNLERSHPMSVGGFDVQVDVAQVKVPLNLFKVVLGKNPVKGEFRVHGGQLRIASATKEETFEEAPAQSGGRLRRALRRFCNKTCRIKMSDMALIFDTADANWGRPNALGGVATIDADGLFTAALSDASGLSIEANGNLFQLGSTLVARVEQPPPLEMRGEFAYRLENQLAGQLGPSLGSVVTNLQSTSEGPESVAAVPIQSISSKTEIGSVEIDADRRIHIRKASYHRSLSDSMEVRVSVNDLVVSRGGRPGCENLPLCIHLLNGVSLSAGDQKRSLTAKAEAAKPCGDGCLAVLNARLVSEGLDFPFVANIERVRTLWDPDTRLLGEIRADNGTIAGLPIPRLKAPPRDPTTDEQKKDQKEQLKREDRFARYARAQTLRLDNRYQDFFDKTWGPGLLKLSDDGYQIPGFHLSDIEFSTMPDAEVQARGIIRSFGFRQSGAGRLTIDGRIDLSEARIQQRVLVPASEDTEAEVRFNTTDISMSVAGSGVLNYDGSFTSSFSGRLPKIEIDHPMIAPKPVEFSPLDFAGTFTRVVRPGRSSWFAPNLEVKAKRGGVMRLHSALEINRSNPKRSGMSLRLEIPKQDCWVLFKSIPTAMMPGLEQADFRGKAELTIDSSMRFHRTYNMELEVEADFDSCRILSLGRKFDINAMTSNTVVYRIKDPTLDDPVLVGPGTRDWTEFPEIPTHVWGAALATEDLAFWSHYGFMPSLIKRGIILNLDRGRYVYGGSTITQQLVKNLFLYRQKTLARKLVEGILVWAVERQVPKRRILELYLNCIEFGPEIYGIKKAAAVYFGQLPADLNPVEATYIMNLKPDPPYGYRNWRRRRTTQQFIRRLEQVKTRLLDREWVTPEDAEIMVPEILWDRAAPVRR